MPPLIAVASPLLPQQESSITFHVELGPRSLLCQLLLVHDEAQITDTDEGCSGSDTGAQYAW